MSTFTIHTAQDATPPSREKLRAIEDHVGFVPNVYGLFAGSPAALQGLTALNAAFEASSFSPLEREVIALSTSVFNRCSYCVAGHSLFADTLGMDQASLTAIRAGGVASEPRLAAIGRITIDLLETQGQLSPAQLQAFIDAGFAPAQLLELLLGVAGKMMTNLASKAAGLPLDEAFQPHAWVHQSAVDSDAA